MLIDRVNDNFSTICLCAMRYVLGRETYMPGLVQNYIKAHINEINRATIAIMIRDIDEADYIRTSPQSQGRYFRTFLSIEPMLERFGKCDERGSVAVTDWVIVGAETGNRKDKVIPQKEWIMELAEECDKRKKPIFMKESLRALMGEDFRQEFPWKD